MPPLLLDHRYIEEDGDDPNEDGDSDIFETKCCNLLATIEPQSLYSLLLLFLDDWYIVEYIMYIIHEEYLMRMMVRVNMTMKVMTWLVVISVAASWSTK